MPLMNPSITCSPNHRENLEMLESSLNQTSFFFSKGKEIEYTYQTQLASTREVQETQNPQLPNRGHPPSASNSRLFRLLRRCPYLNVIYCHSRKPTYLSPTFSNKSSMTRASPEVQTARQPSRCRRPPPRTQAPSWASPDGCLGMGGTALLIPQNWFPWIAREC